jgi:hypothetical protein
MFGSVLQDFSVSCSKILTLCFETDFYKGDGDLPAKSGIFMLVFAIAFGAISAVKTYAVRKELHYAKYIPSGVALQ